ncbi:HMG-box, partial [Agrocybe pediades]
RDPEHIPRPRNAFIFFRSYFIDHILPSGAGQQQEISKLAGEAWRKLSKVEREPFVQCAKLERETHRARYPDYIYS